MYRYVFKGRNTVPPAGEWLQYETINRWSLTTIWLNWTNGLLRLINNMVTELIRPVNYNPGSSQKLIKLEISSCRCLQLECNKENDETEGYSALYTPLRPLSLNGHRVWGLTRRRAIKEESKVVNPNWWDGRGLMLWLFVRPTGVYFLDFFCSGIQFYLLLSPYLCFISLLYLDLYVLGGDALIS